MTMRGGPELIRGLLIKTAKGEVEAEPRLLCSAYWTWRKELGAPLRRMAGGRGMWVL